jgi:rubredoxin
MVAMVLRRRPRNLTDYRSVLDREGEVGIGGVVRRERRRNVILACMGLLLVGAAAWVYVLLLPTGEDGAQSGRIRVKVQCFSPSSCGFVGVATKDPGATPPLVCPKCKQRTCRELWWCQDCKLEFLPEKPAPEQGARPRPGNERWERVIVCPRCKGSRVGSAVIQSP